MIEIWPLWWVDRALTAFSAIMDFESTIFRSIFIRKMIRHSFNYLLMLYVSYNLHESKEVLFVFHPLPNSFQVENSRKIHANPQSLNLTCSNAIMPFIVTSGCPTENRLRRDKVNWAVPTKGENWYKWFQYNAPLTGDDDASFAWRKEIALTQGARLGRLSWFDAALWEHCRYQRQSAVGSDELFDLKNIAEKIFCDHNIQTTEGWSLLSQHMTFA